MIFLIEFNRPIGALVRFESFEDSKRTDAEALRLQIELTLREKKIDHEVVLLEAINAEDLRKTHRRYFEDIKDIARKAIQGDAA